MNVYISKSRWLLCNEIRNSRVPNEHKRKQGKESQLTISNNLIPPTRPLARAHHDVNRADEIGIPNMFIVKRLQRGTAEFVGAAEQDMQRIRRLLRGS